MSAIFQPYPAESFFELLPETLRNSLILLAKTKRFRDGEEIHHRGAREQGLSVIESGGVRISNVGRDGKRVSMITLGAGESFGEFTLFADTPRLFDFHASGSTVLKVIGRRAFEKLLETNPELSKFIIEMLARRLLLAAEILDDERRLPLAARLAKTLLRRLRSNAGEVNFAVTQKELADELTVSRVALGTALDKLRKSGLLETSYGRITILDLPAMRSWIDEQSQLVPLAPNNS